MSWEQCIHVLGGGTGYEPGQVKVRDLPILGVRPQLEALDWLEPGQGSPGAWRRAWPGSAGYCPSRHVAERPGLDWNTVKAIDTA